MSIIECSNLTLGYEGVKVLENLNFNVEKGGYLSVVGENGAGKSTLVKAILGLIEPMSGKIIFGEGVGHSEIGYLPQQSEAQRDFPASVYEIVRSGCLGKIDEMQKNLQVDIPKGVDVEINGISANVYLGMMELGKLSIETDTGCIEAESIRCQSAEIETNSGYIGVGLLTAEKLELDSVSGEIHLGLPSCQNTEIETKNGNVTLYLQGGICALIDFETQKGVLQTQRKYERKGQEYFFSVDDNAAQVEPVKILVETDSGNLRVQ